MTVPGDSKRRLLDAAEKLFSENGFHATSLRQITTAADTNLASVNYHFGSKHGLIVEVFERFLEPINSERIRMLNEVEGANETPDLEMVLRAFVAPLFRFRHEHQERAQRAMRLYGRTHGAADPSVHAIFVRQFDTVRQRFGAAFARALPELSEADLSWRMHFLIGTMAQTMADPERLVAISRGSCDPYDIDATLSHLVAFLVAGMRAPRPGTPSPDAAERNVLSPRQRRDA